MTEYLVGSDLTFSYGPRPVIQGVSLSVATGRATALVGPGGSGKTTLLWLLAGLLPPTSGRMGLASSPDPATSENFRAIHAKATQVGMVFQQPALWDHLTVHPPAPRCGDAL